MTPQELQRFTACQPVVAATWAPLLTSSAREFAIDENDQRLVAWLANLAHECRGFTSLRESLYYTSAARIREAFGPSRFPLISDALPYVGKPEALANRVYSNMLGNGPADSGDGWTYIGRGAIQTTGRGNYRGVGRALDLPLEEHPGMLEMPAVAARAAGWEWVRRGLNELADRQQWLEIRRKINGPRALGAGEVTATIRRALGVV